MKNIARNIAFNTLSLFLLTQIFTGVKIIGGFTSLLVSGFALSLISFFLTPVLKIISFPLNLITLGTFTIVINAIVLFILTLFVKEISINPFTWKGISFIGFIIPKFTFNVLFAYLVVAGVNLVIKQFLVWLTER